MAVSIALIGGVMFFRDDDGPTEVDTEDAASQDDGEESDGETDPDPDTDGEDATGSGDGDSSEDSTPRPDPAPLEVSGAATVFGSFPDDADGFRRAETLVTHLQNRSVDAQWVDSAQVGSLRDGFVVVLEAGHPTTEDAAARCSELGLFMTEQCFGRVLSDDPADQDTTVAPGGDVFATYEVLGGASVDGGDAWLVRSCRTFSPSGAPTSDLHYVQVGDAILTVDERGTRPGDPVVLHDLFSDTRYEGPRQGDALQFIAEVTSPSGETRTIEINNTMSWIHTAVPNSGADCDTVTRTEGGESVNDPVALVCTVDQTDERTITRYVLSGGTVLEVVTGPGELQNPTPDEPHTAYLTGQFLEAQLTDPARETVWTLASAGEWELGGEGEYQGQSGQLSVAADESVIDLSYNVFWNAAWMDYEDYERGITPYLSACPF
ncbi:MAG TPA: hypothetical protein VK866_10220 [Acidimicrobiales bacterium]|nr:hypothetical protein [Acidimicrobiales bacterium]